MSQDLARPTDKTVNQAATDKTRIPGEPGIWFFVAGDLIVFSVFFVLIAIGNRDQADIFAQSRASLDLWIGVVNTLLLLTGSWFVAKGIEKCRRGTSFRVQHYFSLAILSGLCFIGNKIYEWSSKISDGLSPASNDFYMYFFIFTGIHLLHVVVGLGVLLLVRSASKRHPLTKNDMRTLESGATFWHLVDLLWIVLFALLYLL